MLDRKLSGKTLIGIGVLVVVLNVFTLMSKLQPHRLANVSGGVQSGYRVSVLVFQVFMIGMGVVLIVRGVRRR